MFLEKKQFSRHINLFEGSINYYTRVAFTQGNTVICFSASINADSRMSRLSLYLILIISLVPALVLTVGKHYYIEN